MISHDIAGGGGTRLHLREFGQPDGPELLFVHGWSQHHLCWMKQADSALADTFRILCLDLRGHGMSDAPQGAEHYTTSDLWADDIEAVITGLDLKAPVVSAWSYGGYVIADYLAKYGAARLGGAHFIGAAVVIGPPWFGSHIGPGFLDHAPNAVKSDQPTAMRAIRSFMHACVAHDLPAEEMELAIAWNMLVRPDVRLGLISREGDFRPALSALDKPVLVSHGRADTVILPRMSEDILAAVPQAQASWYEGVGHAPFLEAPDRFNAELAAFARQATGTA